MTTLEDVTVFYNKVVENKIAVKESTPYWIKNSVKVHGSLKNLTKLKDISEVSKKLRQVVRKELSIKSLFPVQSTIIPVLIQNAVRQTIFKPHDICVCAPTGSGKTLAYVIPILQIIDETKKSFSSPQAVVVLPVRDLAHQVYGIFCQLAKFLGIKISLLSGHKNLLQEREDLCEGSMADIIVCTPGRLVDHIRNTNEMNLRSVRLMVIDEADRVIKDEKQDWYLTFSRHAGFEEQRYRNIANCLDIKSKRYLQKILVSATLTQDTHLLEHFSLNYPRLFIVDSNIEDSTVKNGSVEIIEESDQAHNTNIKNSVKYIAPEGLQEFLVVCDKDFQKIIFIIDQIRHKKVSKILCFTATKESAERLHLLLKEFAGIRSAYLSCSLSPVIREKQRKDLKNGKLDVLVTVDSTSRGIDIVGVQCVIQYDPPFDVFSYIHRVGRTARGGQKGVAYTLCSSKQVYPLRSKIKDCGRHIKMQKFCRGRCFKYMNEYNSALLKLQNNKE